MRRIERSFDQMRRRVSQTSCLRIDDVDKEAALKVYGLVAPQIVLFAAKEMVEPFSEPPISHQVIKRWRRLRPSAEMIITESEPRLPGVMEAVIEERYDMRPRISKHHGAEELTFLHLRPRRRHFHRHVKLRLAEGSSVGSPENVLPDLALKGNTALADVRIPNPLPWFKQHQMVWC